MSGTRARFFLSSGGYGDRLALAPLIIALLGIIPAVYAAASMAQKPEAADRYADCSAYFFMAANANAMDEFNNYYTAGEYAFNQTIRLVGKAGALERFNAASTKINELIERRWVDFAKADDRYGVICADILRDASDPFPR